MSIPKRMTVNCSKCGNPLSVTVFESVNTNYTDDIAKQIMSGKLFSAECPHCKFVSHLEYNTLYHDIQHGAMIWVVLPNSPEYIEKLIEIRSMPKIPYKMLRIVSDMNALKEKVSCLESNRDDRVVELCKVFCAYNILSQRPDFECRNIFYTVVGGKELIYLYDNEDNDLCCELSNKVYNHLKELYYSSHYATQFDNNYPIVDYEWAQNVLTPLVEAKLDNLAPNKIAGVFADPIEDMSITGKKVCFQCKAVLPSDSEFCQECGTKLFTPISEPALSNDVAEELLSEFEIMEIKGSHPVIIQSAHLYCSSDREKYYLRCKFKSLSDKVISALMVDVYCFDVWGNELPTIRDAQVLDLSPKRDEVFGFSWKIPIADANTRTVNVKLKRIRFADGTIEECFGEETKFPAVVSLSEHFNSLELIQQYNYETSNKSSFVPKQIGEFWMCSCGKINGNAENDCKNCGINKQVVFEALNEGFLTGRYSDYIESKRIKEVTLKQEQEKLEKQRAAEIENERNLAVLKRVVTAEVDNKNKRITKVIIIAIVCVLVSVFVPIFIINSCKESAYNAQERNIAVGEMSDDFSNVYADIVSFDIRYTVTTSKRQNNAQVDPPTTSDVICWCETIEGKKFWLIISTSEYSGTIEHRGKNLTENYDDQYLKKPIRVFGYMSTFGSSIDNAPSHLEDTLILQCIEIV